MDVWSSQWNKSVFLPSSCYMNTTLGGTTWTLTKRLEKKLDGNCTRILRIILNKSRKQHPTKQHLYVHLSLITETILVRQRRHAEHYWRSKDEFIRDIVLGTPSHGCASISRPTRTYLQKLSADTGDLPRRPAENDGWFGWIER